MANSNSKAKKATGSSTKKPTKETAAPTQPSARDATTTNVSVEGKGYRVKKELDPNMYVTVKNGFNGTLVYKSKKTGERFIWNAFGDEQEMELSELKSARNSNKAFFVNNWFLFDDPEVVDWLGMSQFYKHALNTKGFEDLFKRDPDDIKKAVSELSAGQKKSVAFRAKQMIADGEIDSIKTINALEESLSIELIER